MSPEMMLAKMLSAGETSVEKTASVEEDDGLSEAMEKLAWADEMGRSLARRDMEKVAIPAMTGMTKALGHGMQALTTSSGMKRGLIGAGVGAAGGALKDPGVDPTTGQKKSRLGNMAVGAGLGAGAGVASGHLARAAGGMNNTVGRTLGGAQKAVAKQTGNVASQNVARSMQVDRMGAQTAAARTRQMAKGPVVQPPGAKPLPTAQPKLTSNLTGLPAGTDPRVAASRM